MEPVNPFSKRLPGQPLVDYYLIDLSRPESWAVGSPIWNFIQEQKALGNKGVVKYYDRQEQPKESGIVKQMDFDLSKSTDVKKHEENLAEMRRRHAHKNIRPSINWSEEGLRTWRGMGAPRHTKDGTKIWDVNYYVHCAAIHIPGEAPYTLTQDDQNEVKELGKFDSIGATMRAANRANALKYDDNRLPF